MERKEISDLEHFMFNLRYDGALTRTETIANWVLRQINQTRIMNSKKELELELIPTLIDAVPISQDGYEIVKGKGRSQRPLVSIYFSVQTIYDHKDPAPLKTNIYVLTDNNETKEAVRKVSSEIPDYLRGDILIESEDIAKFKKIRKTKL